MEQQTETVFDNVRAHREGWELVTLPGDYGVPKYAIDKVDCDDRGGMPENWFASVNEVVNHVFERAAQGSQYHRLALMLAVGVYKLRPRYQGSPNDQRPYTRGRPYPRNSHRHY